MYGINKIEKNIGKGELNTIANVCFAFDLIGRKDASYFSGVITLLITCIESMYKFECYV